MTTTVLVVCTGLFMLLNQHTLNWRRTLELAGYRDAGQIWDGQWWALVSTAFLHIELWHLAFNLYWLWALGGRLELQMGSIPYLVFSLAAAFVSSAMQLTVSSETGIGYSGVGYAIFGLMWQSRTAIPEFEVVITPRIRGLFLAWLFVCLFITYSGAANIGNTAHFSGLLFGCLAAPVLMRSSRQSLGIAGLTLCVIASVVTLCWSPWNAHWLAIQGYNAHVQGDYARAITFYDAALSRDRLMPGVQQNRDQAAEALKAETANGAP